MTNTADFYGIPFEADYLLFNDELEDIPAVYIIYTPKKCLEIGETNQLKTTIEEHKNTAEWVKLSEGEDIYLALNSDDDTASRIDKKDYLISKMQPQIK